MQQDTIENVIERAEKLVREGYAQSQSPDMDPMVVDRLQLEMTALNASIGSLYVKAQFEADRLKEWSKSLTEMVRSLRRINETLNTEKRFTK